MDLVAFELVHGESFAPDRTFFNIQVAEERQKREREAPPSYAGVLPTLRSTLLILGPGRDGPFGPPPGQIPACGFPAPGSHLRSTVSRIEGWAKDGGCEAAEAESAFRTSSAAPGSNLRVGFAVEAGDAMLHALALGTDVALKSSLAHRSTGSVLATHALAICVAVEPAHVGACEFLREGSPTLPSVSSARCGVSVGISHADRRLQYE